MAIAKASRVRGRLDGIVYKQYAGKVVLTKDPDMSRIKPSKEQKAQRNLFREAGAYAKIINDDPELKAEYLKKIKKRHKEARVNIYILEKEIFSMFRVIRKEMLNSNPAKK